MDLTFPALETLGQGRLISVYGNQNDTASFRVGWPLSHDREGMVLSLVSPDADYDGLRCCAAAGIYRVELDSQYLRELEAAATHQERRRLAGDPWEGFLNYAEENKRVTQIRDFSGKRLLFGVPVAHTGDTLRILRISADGTPGKVSSVKRGRILWMVCESDTETDRQSKLQGV